MERLLKQGVATRRAGLLAVAAGIGCLLAGSLAAQDNPLVGVWRHTEPASPSGPAYMVVVAFAPDGTYEERMIVGTNAQGTGSGALVIRGQYRLTSPSSYAYREMSAMDCASGVPCSPSQMPIPNFGTPKTVGFRMTGPGTMTNADDGSVWFRLR
ncbi:MAG: hypothetical protein P4L71_11970 [Acetobacteraceae bacterium]|nr:hypothetical protein [Acetobacteraceae bacterium]